MLVMTSYNAQNETQDIFDAATSLCVFYGSPSDVLEWLVMHNAKQINLSTYECDDQPRPIPHT